MTVNPSYFKELLDWYTITGQETAAYVVYAGTTNQQRLHGTVIAWDRAQQLVSSEKVASSLNFKKA
jgi:hypothetical protein